MLKIVLDRKSFTLIISKLILSYQIQFLFPSDVGVNNLYNSLISCRLCLSRVPNSFNLMKFIMARKELANGVCRLEFDTAECCFDGGDCGCKTCGHVS